MGNLLQDLPGSLAKELVSVISQNSQVRIERIVSTGHRSADDFWYDQAENEWVVLLQGEGHLIFDGQTDAIKLKPGDHILIPSHTKHRVDWTSDAEPTVWLAVFFSE